MTNDVSGVRTSTGSPGPAGPARAAGAPRPWRPWWLFTILSAILALVAGAVVQHAVDQRNAAAALYRIQVGSTVSRFLAEAGRQLRLPAAQRSISALGDVGDSISQDLGLNGQGTLTAELREGSTRQARQIVFAVNITSPHADTTVVIWDLSAGAGPGAGDNQGACVQYSSLLGAGRATRDLDLGAGQFLAACPARYWSPGPLDGKQPRFALAGIHPEAEF